MTAAEGHADGTREDAALEHRIPASAAAVKQLHRRAPPGSPYGTAAGKVYEPPADIPGERSPPYRRR
jgi:uncharacterized protein (DUF2342 family)